MDAKLTTEAHNAQTGAQLLAGGLKALEISRVFALCGDQVNAIFNALSQVGIEVVGTRHETAAVHMADAWARATGEVGVAIVTGGPGHTNAVTGLAVAHGAGSPVIVISGQAPIDKRDRGGTQVLHQQQIVEPVTKFAREVTDVRLVPEMLYRAYMAAVSPTPGPVSLSFPVDVFNARASGYEASFEPHPRKSNFAKIRSVSHDLEGVRSLLSSAKAPVAIVGSGAHWDSGAEHMQSSLKSLGIPLFTVELARGLVPDDGEVCFGYADPRFNKTFRAVEHADLVLLVGTSFDFHTLFGKPPLFQSNAKIIQIVDDPLRSSVCRPSDVVICGNIGKILLELGDLVEDLRQPATEAWIASLRELHASSQSDWKDIAKGFAPSEGVHPLQICRSLARHFTSRTGMTVDVGDFVHWPRTYFPALQRGHLMDGSVMGTLGAALPQAIGMQLAFPGDPIVAFMGDGGFAQASWELSTAVENNLPIKLVVGNDSAWGVELRLQEAEFGESVQCLLPTHRLDRFAELVGAKGIHVESENDLDAAVDELMAAKVPCLLDVKIPRRCGRPMSDIAIPM
ncbi:thiamine pyrophosphate-binding protein [Pelagibacterium luteolum]|uniref:Acetolactate synthase-1/2/3 large subunit n=1 Tax=Pelagibacterium luteolum TaxID=440168 RepID=A0A1G7ZS90_9HYPH|nr:thiamine pyrophosphate-binding protein [Pelagibacterium luteolum]SDH11544.1 acetolactate synthase-1/2/3 large subunit [Pelagibacterium luteolum]